VGCCAELVSRRGKKPHGRRRREVRRARCRSTLKRRDKRERMNRCCLRMVRGRWSKILEYPGGNDEGNWGQGTQCPCRAAT
jgi:hypothetical protein